VTRNRVEKTVLRLLEKFQQNSEARSRQPEIILGVWTRYCKGDITCLTRNRCAGNLLTLLKEKNEEKKKTGHGLGG